MHKWIIEKHNGKMESMPEIIEDDGATEEELQSKERFLQMISRGGLMKPSDMLFILCSHAHALYTEMTNSDKKRNGFYLVKINGKHL